MENVSYFSHKMLLIVGMSDFIGVPQLKILDLSNVMKMLRTQIIQNVLPKFNPLVLKLGSGVFHQIVPTTLILMFKAFFNIM